MRRFAIGDIHGCYTALLALDTRLVFGPQDEIITLGDYVDRGPDSRLVIEHLIGLAQRATLIPLLGNHEIMMLEARMGGDDLRNWMETGGDTTLDSYRAKNLAAIPGDHWRFLEACRPFYETDFDFFVHANAYPDCALADQPDYMLYWETFNNPPPHQSGRRMICGHTQQRNGKPLDLGHAVCLDTLAYGGGWLSCLEIGTGIYWQANQLSQIRTGQLSA